MSESAPTGTHPDDFVRLTVVRDELEAEMLCGLLRTEGIVAEHRPTNLSVASWIGEVPGAFARGAHGPLGVYVRGSDYGRAAAMLPGANAEDDATAPPASGSAPDSDADPDAGADTGPSAG